MKNDAVIIIRVPLKLKNAALKKFNKKLSSEVRNFLIEITKK